MKISKPFSVSLYYDIYSSSINYQTVFSHSEGRVLTAFRDTVVVLRWNRLSHCIHKVASLKEPPIQREAITISHFQKHRFYNLWFEGDSKTRTASNRMFLKVFSLTLDPWASYGLYLNLPIGKSFHSLVT